MSSITRNEYQRVVEENKKLMADIRILVSPPNIKKSECVKKWLDIFEKEVEHQYLLHLAAKAYIEEHKDELPDFLTK